MGGDPATKTRRLSTATLRPPDVELEIDGELYVIRGNLEVDQIVHIYELERRINEVEEDDMAEQLSILREAVDVIHQLILERHPEAPRPKFGIGETLGVLAFLAGDLSVALAVARALTGEELVEGLRSGGAKAEGEGGKGADVDPLASAKRSPRRSSR